MGDLLVNNSNLFRLNKDGFIEGIITDLTILSKG